MVHNSHLHYDIALWVVSRSVSVQQLLFCNDN
uniref:Uncharacterized protein n=1 Tax=Arundo donax TaxID=35708 RepID=A0A0A8Y585_ARUDO